MAGSALKEYVRSHAEDRPGVYRWLGPDGSILYVGKSVRVKSRLLSYFREEASKAARLVFEATDVTWEYVPNEFGALVREMRLIQSWQPRYNRQHKRKRRYAFIKVTREPAPRLVPVTRVVDDGASYYGPFGKVGWVADSVRDLARVMGLRDCPGETPVFFGDQLEMFGGTRTPLCMRADTGSCLAPCAGRCTADEYEDRVVETTAFLEGRATAPLDSLETQVRAAAQRLDFEFAATLQERRERLGKLQDYLASFRGQIDNLSLVYKVPGYRGNDRLYLIHQGRIRGDLPLPKSDGERAQAKRLVKQTYHRSFGSAPPRLNGDAAGEVLLTLSWFKQRPKERARALSPSEWLATG